VETIIPDNNSSIVGRTLVFWYYTVFCGWLAKYMQTDTRNLEQQDSGLFCHVNRKKLLLQSFVNY